ncbi:MAG TPA: cytidylate kinase family protein [archaeon]|nr:cytidylate kinase family protein [archaeon]
MKVLVIAVSGPPGSGSTTISKMVAKKLKLSYYSPGEAFKNFSKKKESEAALEVWSKFGESKDFHEKNFDNIQMEMAKKGNIVICGKLSIHMLYDIADYKIWIESDLSTRAKRTAERDDVPFDQALEEISKREKVERENWKKIYGFDYFDQKKSADFFLENSKLTAKEAVDKILDFIKRMEESKSP